MIISPLSARCARGTSRPQRGESMVDACTFLVFCVCGHVTISFKIAERMKGFCSLHKFEPATCLRLKLKNRWGHEAFKPNSWPVFVKHEEEH